MSRFSPIPLVILIGTFLLFQASSAAKLGKAFTLYQLLSIKDFQCLFPQAQVPVVRVYAGEGVDQNGLMNIENAQKAGFKGIEVYVQPGALTSKMGAQQFDEAYSYLNDKYPVQRVWLLVTDPRFWSTKAQSNLDFIRDFIKEANSKKVAVGIYTNWYDWLLITKDFGGLQSECSGGCALWYWHTLGQGSAAQTPQDFSDFRQFGSWKSAAIKEYDIADNQICGQPLNWSVFSNGKKMTGKKDGLRTNRTFRKVIGSAAEIRRHEKAEMANEHFVIGDAF